MGYAINLIRKCLCCIQILNNLRTNTHWLNPHKPIKYLDFSFYLSHQTHYMAEGGVASIFAVIKLVDEVTAPIKKDIAFESL